MVRLSLGAVVLVALGACGTEPADTGAGPSGRNTSSSSARPADPITVSVTPAAPVPTRAASPNASSATSASAGSATSASAGSGSSDADADPDAPDAPTTSRNGGTTYVRYAGGESGGIVIRRPADTAGLTGAPASFKAYIGKLAHRVSVQSTCPGGGGAVEVTVADVRSDGFASGHVSDCGGYTALWARVDGRWTQVDSAEDQWHCTSLRHYRVPSQVVGDSCYDDQTHATVAYDQR